MKPADRSIDQTKVNTYLDSVTDDIKKDVVKNIINNTKYITFKNVKDKFLSVIDQLPKKYNLCFLTDAKIGSEHWLTVLLWPYLKPGCVKVINSSFDLVNLDNDHPILLIDDCMYSGCHMCGVVDTLQFDYKQLTKKKLINSFVIVTAYRGIYSTSQLECDFGPIKIISGEIIDPPEFCTPEFGYENFDSESDLVLPIYFDHKIANNFGSYPEIYTKIIKEQPSRYQIERLESILEKK